jgi:hypothetical protein
MARFDGYATRHRTVRTERRDDSVAPGP